MGMSGKNGMAWLFRFRGRAFRRLYSLVVDAEGLTL